MKLKLLATLACLCLAPASHAFSLSGVDRQQLRNMNPLNGEDHESCANFAGTWVGQCQSDDQQYEDSVTLTLMHCEHLSMDGDSYDIGGLNTKTSSNHMAYSSESTNLEWNSDRTQIHYTGTAMYRMSGQDTGSNATVTAKGSGVMKLSDGKLLTTGETELTVTDQAQEKSSQVVKSSCTYTRQ